MELYLVRDKRGGPRDWGIRRPRPVHRPFGSPG